MKPDQFHGQGGTYEVVDGVRRRVDGSTLEHHKDGDTARSADGKVTHTIALNAKPEAALPAPQPAPWATPAAPKPDAARRGPAAPADATTTKGA